MSLSSEALERSTEKLSHMMEDTVELNLNDGALEEEDLCALTTIIVCQSFPDVKSLSLRNNGLTDKQVATLVAALNYDECISTLDLGENELSQRAVYHLLMCLSSLNETLKNLSLDNNVNICNTGVRYIAEIIENCPSIVKLNLSGIDLERRSAVLGGACSKNSTLKELNLQSTSLYTIASHVFIQALVGEKSCTALEVLNLNYNPIETGNFEIYLPLFVSEKLASLRVLHLSFNQLMFNSGKFSDIITTGLAQNSTLEKISLQGNLFNSKDCKKFVGLFDNLTSGAQEIDLRENCISVNGARILVEGMRSNKWIRSLDLRENRFLQHKEGKAMNSELQEILRKNRGELAIPPRKAKRDSPAFAPPLRSRSIDTASINKNVSMATRGESIIMDTSEDVFISLNEETRQLLRKLSTEFPQALPKPKAERSKLKEAKRRLKQSREEQQRLRSKGLSALSSSLIDLQAINKNLGRSTRMVSVVEQVQSSMDGYASFLPSEIFKEISANTILAGVGLIEMLVHGLKLVNVVLWAVLQAFTGYQESEKRVCSKIIKKFFENTEEKDLSRFSGIKVLQRLVSEIVDALLLTRPIFALGEALFMVMSSERATQPSLAYYEKRDAKYEKRAQKHIDRKLKKVEKIIKRENVKKALLRARAKIKNKEGSRKGSKATTQGDGPLTKALRGIQYVQQLEEKKAVKSTNGSSVVTNSTRKQQIEVPEETIRFRENCPERVDDVLDDLQSNIDVLQDMLNMTSFQQLLHVFVGTDNLKAHAKNRVTALQKVYPGWFSDLESEFKSEELVHLREEIVKDISKSHLTLANFLPIKVKEVAFEESLAVELLQHKRRQATTLSFVKQLEKKVSNSDAASLKNKFIKKLQHLAKDVCKETLCKKTMNLKAQFES